MLEVTIAILFIDKNIIASYFSFLFCLFEDITLLLVLKKTQKHNKNAFKTASLRSFGEICFALKEDLL